MTNKSQKPDDLSSQSADQLADSRASKEAGKRSGGSDQAAVRCPLPPDFSIAIVNAGRRGHSLESGIRRLCGMSCQIAVFHSAPAFLKDYTTAKYALLFIDCGLPDGAAEKLFRCIRACGDFCPVICIVSSLTELPPLNQYHYFGILSRPIRRSELEALLDDAVRYTGHKRRALVFGPASSPMRIAFSDIEYVMSDRHNVQVQTTLRRERFRRSFGSVAEELDDARFLSCNRGVIINMDYVDSFDNEAFRMRDGATFSIKRNGLRQVRNTYLEYAQAHRGITRYNEEDTT